MKNGVIILVILAIAAWAHAVNMFHFPYFENDEGVYLSQAWAVTNLGKLAPYTYWYDHAPLGWVFTAGWLKLTGGLYTFGFSLNSGRVLMLVIHTFSSLFLLLLGKRLTGSWFPGALAVMCFSFSPLGLYFQRRLLLDNLMIFWVLLALVVLTIRSSRVSQVILSGLVFGAAILTKENAIFFIPSFILTIWLSSHKQHRKLLAIKWLFMVMVVVSTYFLMALLKGELFPYGTPVVGGAHEHVSLLGTLKYQYSRAGGDLLTKNFNLWIRQDAPLIYIGTVANLIWLGYAIWKKREWLGAATLGVAFWIFLIRGGLVIEFYIVPLIPLLALSVGMVTYLVMAKWAKVQIVAVIVVTMALGWRAWQVIPYSHAQEGGYKIFGSDQTGVQLAAIEWIRKFVSPKAVVIIDNYAWLELRDPQNPSGKVFEKAHWYWKADLDREVKDLVLGGDPASIQFIARTPQMSGDLESGASPTTLAALNHANLATGFNQDGWGVEIWTTNYPDTQLLTAWEYYKDRFVTNGQVVDPSPGHTTSEGQAYALLRAVMIDDQTTFNQVWKWTQTQLQNSDGTLAWQFKNGQVTDRGSAADADVDAAMALILAQRRWGELEEINYDEQIKKLLGGIWEKEVKTLSGKNYLVAGNWAKGNTAAIINPSYLSPAAFRMFAEVDAERPWMSLVESSYDALWACTTAELEPGQPSANLPPNWCVIDADGRALKPAEPGLASVDYSYDAIRVMWRVAWDYQWFKEMRAKNYLELTAPFIKTKLQEGKLWIGYTHGGGDWEKYESPVGYAAALANLAVTDPVMAKQVWTEKINSKFYTQFDEQNAKAYWDDPNNYYTQNIVWLSLLLYPQSETKNVLGLMYQPPK